MMRNLILLSFFTVGSIVLAEDTLELHSGESVTEKKLLFDGTRFLPEKRNSDIIDRNSVATWRLGNGDTDTARQSPNGDEPGSKDTSSLKERLDENYCLAQESAAQHPGVIGVQVIDHGTFTLTPDGQHGYRYHFSGLILNEDAMDWGSLSIQYKEGRNTARIIEAHSYSPENGIQSLAPNDIQTSSPSQDGEFFSTDLKNVNAVIPGAEVGSLIDFVLEFNTPEPEVPELFMPAFYFQGDIPVLSSRLDIVVPKDIKLKYWTENWPDSVPEAPNTQVIEVAGESMNRYRWHLKDMQPTVDEPMSPPASEVVPAVFTTIVQDWSELDKLVGTMQKERIQVTDEIKALAQKLTADCGTDAERVANLYHWVQKNIRYISIKSSLSSGWSGHPAPQTLAQGYGDCTDKSILFSALLRAVGIDANPVVVRTNDEGLFRPRYPVIKCNHCITKVFLDSRAIYLDATSQDHRYPALRADDHGVMAFDFIKSVYEEVPVPSPGQADARHVEEKVELRADGRVRITTQNTYAGQYEARLRGGWKTVPVPLQRQIMQQYLNSIAPGSTLLEFEISDPSDLEIPFSLSYSFENTDLVSQAGDFLVLQLPGRELQFPEIALDTRQTPIAYTTAELRTSRTVIVPEDGLSIVAIPENETIRTFGPVKYTESFERSGTSLTLITEFLRTPQRVPTEKYPEYRDALQTMRQASRRVLLFHK